MPEAESVKVAVRVRPFNQREKDRNATCIIRMFGVKTVIINPDDGAEKDFAFDFSYWSHDGFDVLEEAEPDLDFPGGGYNAPTNRRGGATSSEFGCEYASQKHVFKTLGDAVLTSALEGYNCCLFAYGQTGSGKSYSFVGYGSNKGVVPQVCDEVFKRKTTIEASGTTKLLVTFSMMEIYNEKIRDLLNSNPKTNNDLKVRTTPKGTYVEGAKAVAVDSFEKINATMEAGTASRTVAATQMNATSSRAHTIMTITVCQEINEDGRKKEIKSDMNLVDLAGSERAESTGATGDRLKEGAAINKSLSSLGNVISALADQANNPKKKIFIPYRDSKLTQILQSALGGNSKTIMVAALSPADINFEETLSTLRYADRAKQIKVVVEVQENPTDKIIRQLKEENEKLRLMMESMGGGGPIDLDALNSSASSGEPPAGTITEDQMQEAIDKAVAECKAASAAEKKAAVAAAQQEMMARHEGLMRGMMARGDMEATIKDVIMQTKASPEAKEKALEAALSALRTKYAARGTEGGKLDQQDALHVVEEALEQISGQIKDGGVAEAMAEAEKVLAEGQPCWADGVLDWEELEGLMAPILAPLGLDAELQAKCVGHAQFAYTEAKQSALGEMLSKSSVLKLVAAAVEGIGDAEAAKVQAEMRFDQLQRDAQDGAVDEGVMNSTLERAMAKLDSVDAGDKKAAMMRARREAGWNTSKNLNAAADAQARAKTQIAQTLANNTKMMADLAMSFEDRNTAGDEEAAANAAMLKSLGISTLSKEEMAVTPSLRNLNQDPMMSDALVYYLSGGETIVTTPDDDELPDGAPTIQLHGGGMTPKHCSIYFDRSAEAPIKFMPGSGVAFVNGQQVTKELDLKHNDRLILGNSQAFRVVDPKDPEASKPTVLIDWDLATTELNEAMGTAVDLKVEEEVAKKKAELDAQLAAMQEKFARENEKLRAELMSKDPGAAQEARLKQMDKRKRSIEVFAMKSKQHVQEYKRDLIRLEEQLKKVVPRVKEANTMAMQLGRCVKLEAALVTYVPESTIDNPLSPIEELLTQKVTELMVKCVLHNPRSDMRREWFWMPEPFYDRIAKMREVWQKWMLEQVMAPMHSPTDPFWSAPASQLVGSSYLYLAPLAYGAPCSQWIPIVNYMGTKAGELRVHLAIFEADFATPLKPTPDVEFLKGKPLNFSLTIEQARGLMDCPNKNVKVEYTFSDEEGKRSTPPAAGKKFDPKFSEVHKFAIPVVSDDLLTYLQKDAICFEMWGELDDVEEEDVAEAISMELPPETFEFFLSHDVRIADSGNACGFEQELGRGKKPGHVLQLDTPHKLIFAVAQADKHFKVCEVGRLSFGNVRDEAGKPVGKDWTAVQVAKQGRASESEPWIVEADWTFLPKGLEAGKVYTLDLKADVQEVERLGLEEPLGLVKTLTIKVAAQGGAPGGPVEVSQTKKRFRLTASVQEIYMGQFEVSDAAVNAAMMDLRDQSDEGSKDVIKELDENVGALQKVMVEEEARQKDDLALKMAQLGFDIADELQLSQLPSDLLGGGGSGDAEDLKKQIADLKAKLQAANDRIAYLEGGLGTTKASAQIAQLRKKMVEAKADRALVHGEDPRSKACTVS